MAEYLLNLKLIRRIRIPSLSLQSRAPARDLIEWAEILL